MRLFLTLYLLLMSAISLYAQNSNNYLQVNTNTGLNFVCNSPESLENDQTINGAFTIRVRSKNNNCSIYAKISSFIGPSGFNTTNYPIQLDYTSTNSNKVFNIVSVPLTLTSVDQRLFNQYSSNNLFDYYYNLILKAPGYTYPLGHYNFVILFTMTQP